MWSKVALMIQTEIFHKYGWQYLVWCGPSLMWAPLMGGEEDELQEAKCEVGNLQLVSFFWQHSWCLPQTAAVFASSHELMNCHNIYREGFSFLSFLFFFFFVLEAFSLWPILFCNYSVHEQTLCEIDAALLSEYSLTLCSWGLPIFTISEKSSICVSIMD